MKQELNAFMAYRRIPAPAEVDTPINPSSSAGCAAMLKNADVTSSPEAGPVAELLANPTCHVILSPHWTFR